MPDSTINGLSALTTLDSADELVAWDASASTSKKITKTNFLADIHTSPALTGTTTTAAITNSGNIQTATLNVTGNTTINTALTGVLRADSGLITTDSDVTDLVSAASQSAAGKVELATSTEINTGTDSTRAMPVDQFVASNRNVRYVLYRVYSATTDWEANGTTTVGGDLEFPFTGTITEIGAYVDTAGTTGTAVVDVNKNGTTLMTTNKLSFDTGEKTTRTAATAPALTTTSITAGDLITVDIDTNHTTKAKGLTIRIGVRMT